MQREHYWSVIGESCYEAVSPAAEVMNMDQLKL
jgi:hypothetical protein